MYYAAPGGMKLHASNGCTLLSHTKSVATLTVSPDVHAFLLRAQVVCARCGHEAAGHAPRVLPAEASEN